MADRRARPRRPQDVATHQLHVDPLAGLDDEQRAVARSLEGPLVVLAGAGTGKTHAITRRIAYACLTGAHRPEASLAVTFTTKAADELRERLARLGVAGVQARTFHSAALRQLRYFWPRVVGGAPPTIVEAVGPRMDRALLRAGVRPDSSTRREYGDAIKRAKVNRLSAADLAGNRLPPGYALPDGVTADQLAAVYAGYDELLAERGERDLDDVLLLTVAVLEDRPDALDEVRRTYRWFTVDEFQDVNPLQMRLLELWTGQERELCVVGDAAQTIFSFTGATSDYLTGLASSLPPQRVIRLHRSYRCPPPVVVAANRLQQHLRDQRATVVLTSAQPTAAAPQVRIVECADERAEAEWVAEQIAILERTGCPLGQIAVLYRLHALSQPFEEALTRRGCAHRLRGSERFLDRPVIRQALTLLRAATASTSAPRSGAPRLRAAVPEASLVEQVREVLASLVGTSTVVGDTAARSHLGSVARERSESVAVLVGLADAYAAAADGTAELAGFLADLERRASVGAELGPSGVTLSTIHAAKGLEWQEVFLVGAVDSILPGQGEPEEERRLCYVAATRARHGLAITWARSRAPGGGVRIPSRFLAEIAGEPQPSAGGGAAGGRRRSRTQRPVDVTGGRRQGGRRRVRCSRCGVTLTATPEIAAGSCMRCAPEPDADLVARLREWRAQQARELGLPAYLILTNVTIDAIAQVHPSSLDELAAITGIGPQRLMAYGAQLLALTAGRPEPESR